jgi:hypothetical protein
VRVRGLNVGWKGCSDALQSQSATVVVCHSGRAIAGASLHPAHESLVHSSCQASLDCCCVLACDALKDPTSLVISELKPIILDPLAP